VQVSCRSTLTGDLFCASSFISHFARSPGPSDDPTADRALLCR
jgi:hypothetical protein